MPDTAQIPVDLLSALRIGTPDGGVVLPHYSTFAMTANLAARAYMATYDEALRHGWRNAQSMYYDAVVQGSLRIRQLATILLPWKLTSSSQLPEQKDKRAKLLFQAVEDFLHDIPQWTQFLLALSECIWFGRSGIQVRWRREVWRGREVLRISNWWPVHGDKIVFRWDGTPGVRVQVGALPEKIRDKASLTDFSPVYWLTEEVERARFVIAQYERIDADFYDATSGGSALGVGIRNRIYWLWYLKGVITGYLLDYLNVVGGNGIMVFFYEEGNSRSLEEVAKAVREQAGRPYMLIPRRYGGANNAHNFLHVPPTDSGVRLFESLVGGYLDNCIQHVILNQPLTSALPPNIGADIHSTALGRGVKFDSLVLADAIQRDLINTFLRFVFPAAPRSWYPKFEFVADPPGADPMLNYATQLYSLGIPVDAKQLYEITGIRPPAPSDPRVADLRNTHTPVDWQAVLEELNQGGGGASQEAQQAPAQEEQAPALSTPAGGQIPPQFATQAPQTE